ncbi:hypothetical protein [Gilvimarinus agarilyticus]|uniref:hypothetical protein n=1 Tax=Gilvimarinus agarilyticus TaxID=679259 RepID=UPI0038BB1784
MIKTFILLLTRSAIIESITDIIRTLCTVLSVAVRLASAVTTLASIQTNVTVAAQVSATTSTLNHRVNFLLMDMRRILNASTDNQI